MNRTKKTIKDIEDYISKNNLPISLISGQNYQNNKTKLEFQCNVKSHGNFLSSFNSINGGSLCPKCGVEKRKLQITKPIEKVIEEINNIHKGKIQIVDTSNYKNSHSKLLFKCDNINHPQWETGVYSVVSGKGCPKCSGKNITTEEFIENVGKIHQGNITLLPNQTYKGRIYKMFFKCKNPLHPPFTSSGNNVIFRKSGCPECKKDKLHDINSYSTEQVYLLIKNKYGKNLTPKKGQLYNNQRDKWIFRCREYPEHNEFMTTVDSVLNKKNYVGCRECLGYKILDTLDDLRKELLTLFGDKLILTDNNPKKINSQSDKVEVFCTIHQIIHKEKISNVLKSVGCPKCSLESRSEKRRTDGETLIFQVKETHRDLIEIVDVNQYQNTDTKIEFRCLKKKTHGIFQSSPHSIIKGNGCPICKMSKGERRILFWLRDNEIEHVTQKRIKKHRGRGVFIYDFYLPKLKIFIEYDGRQHFIPIERWGGEKGLKKIQENDKLKDEQSKLLGIEMTRISYTHFEKIESILKRKLIQN